MSRPPGWSANYEQRSRMSSDMLLFLLNPLTEQEHRYAKWLCEGWDLDTTEVIGTMIARAVEQGVAGLDDRAARGR